MHPNPVGFTCEHCGTRFCSMEGVVGGRCFKCGKRLGKSYQNESLRIMQRNVESVAEAERLRKN